MAITEIGPSAARTHGSVDGVTIVLLALTAFLILLSVLALQLPVTQPRPAHRVVVIRRVYQTTVVDPEGGRGGTSVTRAISSSGAVGGTSPTTHVS